MGTENGVLSREDYINVGDRRSSFVSQRDRVYDLYEIYRKRKRELGGYDAAERYVASSLAEQTPFNFYQLTRTHALIRAMNEGIPGAKIDCL